MAKKTDDVAALKARIAELEAQVAASQPQPAPDPHAIADGPLLGAVNASDGDPVVYVRVGAQLQRCRAAQERARQIHVDGKPCDHVADHPDGTWIYEMRSN